MKAETLEKIIQKQDELIEKLLFDVDLYTYKGYYSLNYGDQLKELTTLKEGLQGDECSKTGHYFRGGICKVCGYKIDYTNAC
jgi:hypothetical protein